MSLKRMSHLGLTSESSKTMEPIDKFFCLTSNQDLQLMNTLPDRTIPGIYYIKGHSTVRLYYLNTYTPEEQFKGPKTDIGEQKR